MIVLLTDFGLSDPYVGIMKGVIDQICPGANVVDLSHNLPPHSIQTGSFFLQYSHYHFPEKTVFCSVIDPGVGGDRKALLIETEKYYFVGPDNGLFSFVFENQETNPVKQIISLDNSDYYYTSTPDYTFHGRDIFAPAAAHLEKGTDAMKMGTPVDSIKMEKIKKAEIEDNRLCIPLLHIDHFGNLIFSLTKEQFTSFTEDKDFTIHYKDVHITKINKNYESREKLICLFNSYGLLEIASCTGNAAILTNSAIIKEETLFISSLEDE